MPEPLSYYTLLTCCVGVFQNVRVPWCLKGGVCLIRWGPPNVLWGFEWRPVVWAVEGFTWGRTKERKVYWICCKGTAGRTAEERLLARQWVGAVVKGGRWEGMETYGILPFLVTVPGCKQPTDQLRHMDILRWVSWWLCLYTVRWSLWGLFCIPLLKPVRLKAASTHSLKRFIIISRII